MNEPLPSVTVIIPARPDQVEILAVNAARQLEYPADRLEILVARGRQPSIQRNAALRTAKGEWIYFLDDDSVPPATALRQASKYFADPAIKMVGGPNLCPPDAPALEKTFAAVLSSWLAFGPSRARYTPVGEPRPTGEKELILCNLMARREAMLELGGFNEALYPNEENALMDELRKRGGKLIYDPQLIVHRRPRRTFKAFAKMLRTYGRGRAEQFRVNPTFGSALNFVPPLFCVYLIGLAVVWSMNWGPERSWVPQLFTVPACAYAAAVLIQTLALIPRAGVCHSLGALPLMVFSHVLYGLGFWKGLFTKLKASNPEQSAGVEIERIKSLTSSS